MSAQDRIIVEARSWIGTPYRHQASRKGAGCDCLGLVRGVWRACVGPEPDRVPAYRPDWAELGGEETLLRAARRWLEPLESNEYEPGDVVLFRIRSSVPVKHCFVYEAVCLSNTARSLANPTE